MAPRPVHYVLCTHWDREWYRTFQDFRYRLVQLLDEVLAGWASNRLKGPFQTDGQAIMLEDYLEIRPEKRQEVSQYLKDGKLVAGPWYVMPDEFIVSGELLIRNLKVGRQMVRSLGGTPSKAGFVCDIFGHNSQMPQLFAGFGIQGAFIWRGINDQSRLLLWEGADDTTLPAYKFGKFGYCDFAIQVRHGFEPLSSFNSGRMSAELDSYLDYEAKLTTAEPILMMDTGDHLEWDEPAYQVVQAAMGKPETPYQIEHTSLDRYLDDLVPESDKIKLRYMGELRETGKLPLDADQQWLIPGVLSSRVWIKQTNAACQTLLCQWAEPLSAMAAAFSGYEYPKGYLDVAWKWLLNNHPHDSICGCSIDAVHEDMRYRFHQCQDIGEQVVVAAAENIARGITGEPGKNELRVVVFNSLPVSSDQPVEIALDIPAEWPTFNEFFGFEPKPAFKIYDPDGNEIPYQRLGQDMNRTRIRAANRVRFAQSYKVNVVTVSLRLNLPALGYTTLTVKAGQASVPTRYAEVPGLAVSERSMSNGILTVGFESNGTISITDLRSGQAYSRLLSFEDRADIGDGWFHGIAVNDQIFYSTASAASIALVHNGPLLTSFRVRTNMVVPAEFNFSTMRRSEGMVALVVDSLVSLRAGSDQVEVETTVHNNACDHRFRVLFPSGADAISFVTDTPFDVVERPIALSSDNHLFRELEVETRPQQTWSAIFDGSRGMALSSSGLLEVALLDQPEKPLALTLFRSTRRTVFTEGEPLGQVQGDLTFRYWIVPLAQEPDRVKLSLAGQSLAAGLRLVQLTAEDSRPNLGQPDLPLSASFLNLTGPVVMSSLQEIDGGLEIRIWNPAATSAAVTFDFSNQPGSVKKWATARFVDFESNPTGPILGLVDDRLSVKLTSKQILTVRFEV